MILIEMIHSDDTPNRTAALALGQQIVRILQPYDTVIPISNPWNKGRIVIKVNECPRSFFNTLDETISKFIISAIAEPIKEIHVYSAFGNSVTSRSATTE